MADQGTDSMKTPLLEKAELPSAPPPDTQHASSEPFPPQYSESAYPPPSSAAPRQPPHPPSAQPGSCPYPPGAAEGPPAGGTGYPASAPPVSMLAGQVATSVGGGVTYNVPPPSAYGAYGYGAGANEVARKTSLAIIGVVFVVFCISFCVIIIISIAVPLSIASRFNHAT